MNYQKMYNETEEQLFRERVKNARATARLDVIVDYIDKLPLDETITHLKEVLKELEGEKK